MGEDSCPSGGVRRHCTTPEEEGLVKSAADFQYQHVPSRETTEVVSVPEFSTIITTMAKEKKLTKHSSKSATGGTSGRKGNETWVKEQIRALPGWPYVKVRDWKQIVVDHYRLRESLTTKHRLYQLYKKFVANAKSY